MKIIETDLYINQLLKILKYISIDKISAAKKFKQNLSKNIKNLVNFPYKYRKSHYYNDENIRDMVFERYTIIYRIKKESNIIEVLEIFKKNLPLIKDKNEDN